MGTLPLTKLRLASTFHGTPRAFQVNSADQSRHRHASATTWLLLRFLSSEFASLFVERRKLCINIETCLARTMCESNVFL